MNFSTTQKLSLTNKIANYSLNKITMNPSLLLEYLMMIKRKLSWIDQNRKLSTMTAMITVMDHATNRTHTPHFC